MDIAIAGMTEIDNRYPVVAGNLFQGADHIRHLGAGHDDILVELVGIDLAQAGADNAPDLPDLLRLLLGLGNPGIDRMPNGWMTDRILSTCRSSTWAIAIDLDDQDGPTIGGDRQPCLHHGCSRWWPHP